jgi:hypothetical protein
LSLLSCELPWRNAVECHSRSIHRHRSGDVYFRLRRVIGERQSICLRRSRVALMDLCSASPKLPRTVTLRAGLRTADHVDENRDVVNEFSVLRATPKRTTETIQGLGSD